MTHPPPHPHDVAFSPLLPSPAVTLGVMGGGQLGRMFVHAAQRMGFHTTVLDPDEHSPAGHVSHVHLHTDYVDSRGLAVLAAASQAITTEFENVPAQSLRKLAAQRVVSPSPTAVEIAQDRAREKAHFTACGVPCAPYAVIESQSQCETADGKLFPAILKTTRLGYDGKGQATVEQPSDLPAAWQRLGGVPCVLEKRLPLLAELSVILARGQDGTVVHYPVQRNLHRHGILAVTEAHEQNITPALASAAISATKSIANGLDYVGVLCVEFFVVAQGADAAPALIVNEMAPRPHNSGHYTLDACDQSQFDLQVRTLAGLPLTQPRQHSAAVMLNLLGDLWPAGGEPPWPQVLALPGAHLHLYGKHRALPGRKMGHLTITAATLADARATAIQAANLLGIEPWELPPV